MYIVNYDKLFVINQWQGSLMYIIDFTTEIYLPIIWKDSDATVPLLISEQSLSRKIEALSYDKRLEQNPNQFRILLNTSRLKMFCLENQFYYLNDCKYIFNF